MNGEYEKPSIHHRKITLADGRYMIFYTFDESVPPAPADGAAREKNRVASDVTLEETDV